MDLHSQHIDPADQGRAAGHDGVQLLGCVADRAIGHSRETHRPCRQAGPADLLTVEVVHRAVVQDLVDPDGHPCARPVVGEAGPEVEGQLIQVGQRGPNPGPGQGGRLEAQQTRTLGPCGVVKGRLQPGRAQIDALIVVGPRVTVVHKGHPCTEVHLRAGHRGLCLGHLLCAGRAARPAAGGPVSPIVDLSVGIPEHQGVAGPVRCSGPRVSVVVLERADHRPVPVLERDPLPAVVQVAGPRSVHADRGRHGIGLAE